MLRTPKAIKLTRVSIPNGTVTLAGLVYHPNIESSTDRSFCVVLAHGFTASKESLDLLAAYLCGHGYSCITFDFRGHKLGGSTGELHAMSEAVSDLDAVARWGMRHVGAPHCALVGHSMGALVSFAVAAQMEEALGIAALAAGPEPPRGFRSPAGAAMLTQRADYVAGAEPIRLLEQMEDLVPLIAESRGRPTLFVAARNDLLVKPQKVRELSERAGAQAEFAEVDGGHLDAPDRARGVVANWLDRIRS